MKLDIVVLVLGVVAHGAGAQQRVAAGGAGRTPPVAIDITAADSIEIHPGAVLFGKAISPDTFAIFIRYVRTSGEWQILNEHMVRSRPPESRPSNLESGLRVAPGWTLFDSSGYNGHAARPVLRANRGGVGYPVRISVAPAARAELRRAWDLDSADQLPVFSRIVITSAFAGDYIWLGLKAGSLSVTDGEECRPISGLDCIWQAGGVVQFNTRTKTMRSLLPPVLAYVPAKSMLVAGGHLWIGTDMGVLRYQVIPGTGVRPAPVDTAYPRGSELRAFASDGQIIALLSTDGVAIADAAGEEWRARWFDSDEAADTTMYWLTRSPPRPDTLMVDTTGPRSYAARRGVRLLMDGLELPLARRPAFRASAARLPPSRYIEFFDRHKEGSSQFYMREFLAGAGETAAAALADSVFLPFLIDALGAPDVGDDGSEATRGLALSALLGIPDGAGRPIVHAALDTLHDTKRAVAMAQQMAAEHDDVGRRWLLAKFADRAFLARELIVNWRDNSRILNAPSELRDTAFVPILLELLGDPRFASYVYGSLRTLAFYAPQTWVDLAQRAAVDSSLTGALLVQAASGGPLAFDPTARPILQGLARRVLRLGVDSTERQRFSLDISPNLEPVNSAARLLVLYRDADATPDLVQVVRTGNFWDMTAAALGLVNLTGIASAPPLPTDTNTVSRDRLARFWTTWLARAPRPIVPVSAAAGAAAEQRYRKSNEKR